MQLSDLSEPELNALQMYKTASDTGVGHSACFELNRELRNGIYLNELAAELKTVAENLDSVLKRVPKLSQPMTVYRDVGTRAGIPVNEEGKRFRNLQFWSTSLCSDSVESFLNPVTEKGYGLVLELKLPVGFPAYNMESLVGAGGSEQELLLGRGTLWTVNNSRILSKTEFARHAQQHFSNIAWAELEPIM